MAQQQNYSQKVGPDDAHVKPTASVLQSLNMAPIMTAVSTFKWATRTTTQEQHTRNHPSNMLDHQEIYNSNISSSTHQREGVDKFKRAGNLFIEATVSCAILIKQSPLPGTERFNTTGYRLLINAIDILSLLFGYFVHLLIWVDRHYRVTEKAQDLGIECIKFALYMDEQYQLHEFATEALYMFVAAGIRAAVAYKETPPHSEQKEDHTRLMIRINEENDTNSSRDYPRWKKADPASGQK